RHFCAMARLGEQVDIYCGRCKVERYHTVAALGTGGKIERVVCGYCNTPRKYKDPSAKPVRRAASASTRSSDRSLPEPVLPPRPYVPSSTYDKGDFLDHSKYGRGRVTDVRGDRIDVKFTDGNVRVFRHG